MNTLLLYKLGFIACATVIVFCGTKLTRYGNAIAELTGWSKAWIGLVLMASVTSLPELMTGISSVAVIKEPDLAAGDVFGSCVFNLLILSFVDAWIKKPLTSLINASHLFAGLLSIILIAVCGLAIVLSDFMPVLFWISPFTIVLVILYFTAVLGIYNYDHSTKTLTPVAPIAVVETKGNENKTTHFPGAYPKTLKKKLLTDEVNNPTLNTEEQNRKKELKKVVIAYFENAVFVIAASFFLPYFGAYLAEQSNLGNTFFGTLFLAASTSLPELVVSFAAIRIGAFDLLVGNLLGSNIFNIFILALDDIFYTEGSLFAHIKAQHLETVIVVIMMTAVVGLGIMTKHTRKRWLLSFDTLLILLLYVGLMTVLFIKR